VPGVPDGRWKAGKPTGISCAKPASSVERAALEPLYVEES